MGIMACAVLAGYCLGSSIGIGIGIMMSAQSHGAGIRHQ